MTFQTGQTKWDGGRKYWRHCSFIIITPSLGYWAIDDIKNWRYAIFSYGVLKYLIIREESGNLQLCQPQHVSKKCVEISSLRVFEWSTWPKKQKKKKSTVSHYVVFVPLILCSWMPEYASLFSCIVWFASSGIFERIW